MLYFAQKNSGKGQEGKRAKSQSPGETHATRKPDVADADVGVAPDAAAEQTNIQGCSAKNRRVLAAALICQEFFCTNW
ncbi:MAG UNVERIFIED_CONTAM: hypothetical protein LVR29_33325 [Microcystis novacekii LVE1205-3]